MRIWSLNPKLLDSKGLVAVWREALLAKNVLLGNTKGYRNHPQLDRFKNSPDSIYAINYYLKIIYEESIVRNYSFDNSKFSCADRTPKFKIPLTDGQLNYELYHLLKKIEVRDPKFLTLLKSDNAVFLIKPSAHPLFQIYSGPIESWEITK